MAAEYFHHLTLSTGHSRRSPRQEAPDSAIAIVAPWLESCLESGSRTPVPAAALKDYEGLCLVDAGSLVVSVYRKGHLDPLVTFAVAQRSRHSATLWPMLAATMPMCERVRASGPPEPPWCAVAIQPPPGVRSIGVRMARRFRAPCCLGVAHAWRTLTHSRPAVHWAPQPWFFRFFSATAPYCMDNGSCFRYAVWNDFAK